MQNSDVRLIVDLAEAIRNAPPVQKDPEAAQLIAQLIGSQPDALYVLVQTVLLQKETLARSTAAQGGGGFTPEAAPPSPAEDTRSRWGGFLGPRRAQPAGGPTGGGSFLKTAAAGAAGVAGGVLLAQGISGLFTPQADPGDHAEAAFDDDWTDVGGDDI